ncbi:MAG: Gfo/Idh/MocA family oxidoreductase [Rhodospirillaceae bacterium]|nr:Gfo/Idh/MocA family oxidoreductase [Rhodospirillales bacterium]MBT3906152.1 Gfo/Idh/MocA family oxidoreductase [Rhodospirillaceae bacterium]MBT4702459.1 Gfo/Idh/MocA family oxidoreductase [Rhodospirillaceae bacterium]MBT5034822.1 Gfo/Idh/MocA family oxidoreductase [Rhodospirillaceae bacterium]MBT6219710.1 Gfo/Idh/MocA family oxidoreductase [Rhodospirillaceae bacterium]
MTEPLKIGIAGYGVVGNRRRQVIDKRSDMKVVAVCDQKLGGDGVFDDGVKFFGEYSPLLEENLDVLFVCLTNDLNPDVSIAGLERGLHVFCEKPPGRDVGDVTRVIACHQKHPNLKLKYGFNHRYHDSVLDALRLVQSGELGKVINLRGLYGKSQLITFGQSSWRTDRKLSGGGVLLDQGIHMVDLLRLFAGEFVDVNSFISNGHWNHDVEDNAYALMRTEAGVVAMLHSSATQWRHRFNLEISLELGSITLSGILSGSKSYGAETMTVARTAGDDMGDPREETTRYNKDTSWADEVAEFATAIQDNTPITNGSAEDALKTMGLVYRIYCADSEWKAKWGLSHDVPAL